MGNWTDYTDVPTPTYTYSLEPTLHATASAEAKLIFEPTLELNLDFIGGPTIGIGPFLDLQFGHTTSVSLSDGVDNGSCEGISADLGLGLNVQIGAKLDLSLPGALSEFDETFKTVGPLKLNSKKHSLYSTCIDGD